MSQDHAWISATECGPLVLKFNVKYRNSHLHLAAKANICALTQDLLLYGANINAFFRGKTALMRAIKYSSREVIKLLLNQPDLKVNLQNRAQESALWYAVK